MYTPTGWRVNPQGRGAPIFGIILSLKAPISPQTSARIRLPKFSSSDGSCADASVFLRNTISDDLYAPGAGRFTVNTGFEDGLQSHSRSFLFLVLAIVVATVSPSLAAPPQQSGQRPIVVQVGAFLGPTASGAMVAELEQKGFEPIVVPGDDYYRVVVGPFANSAEANAMMARLKEQGYDSYVRRDLVLPPQTAQSSRRTEAPTRQPTPRPAAPAPAPAQPAPAQAPVRPPAQKPAPVAQPAAPVRAPQPTPSPRVEPTPTVPVREARPTPPPEPAPTAAPTPAVTTNQPPAQPPPVPRPGVPARPAEPEPTAPPAVAQAPSPTPPERPAPQARIAGPSTISAPPVSEPQADAPQAVGQVRGGSRLRILVLEGEGAINNIKQRTSRDPVIQVVDENDRPVGGVAVVFTLPSRGASGVFANGARSLTILTDAQGMATATGLTPNTVAGDLAIQVSASHQGQTAAVTIAQTNVAVGAGMSAATIGIIGAIVAGAAVGAVVALKGNEETPPIGGPPGPGSPPSGTATVRPGGVTIGAP